MYLLVFISDHFQWFDPMWWVWGWQYILSGKKRKDAHCFCIIGLQKGELQNECIQTSHDIPASLLMYLGCEHKYWLVGKGWIRATYLTRELCYMHGSDSIDRIDVGILCLLLAWRSGWWLKAGEWGQQLTHVLFSEPEQCRQLVHCLVCNLYWHSLPCTYQWEQSMERRSYGGMFGIQMCLSVHWSCMESANRIRRQTSTTCPFTSTISISSTCISKLWITC